MKSALYVIPDTTTQTAQFTPDQQAVLDRLAEYPATEFHMAEWLDFTPFRAQEIAPGGVCFTCAVGWLMLEKNPEAALQGGRSDLSTAEAEHLKEIALQTSRAAGDMMNRLIHWRFNNAAFIEPFCTYNGLAVPKAVVIDAVRRVFAGENILAVAS